VLQPSPTAICDHVENPCAYALPTVHAFRTVVHVDSKPRRRMTAQQCAAAIRGLEELVKLGFLEVISADDPDKMFLSYSLSKAYRLAAQLFPAEKPKDRIRPVRQTPLT
jgi:hypothetical protein